MLSKLRLIYNGTIKKVNASKAGNRMALKMGLPAAGRNYKFISSSVICFQQLARPTWVIIACSYTNPPDYFIRTSRSSIKRGWEYKSVGCFYLKESKMSSAKRDHGSAESMQLLLDTPFPVCETYDQISGLDESIESYSLSSLHFKESSCLYLFHLWHHVGTKIRPCSRCVLALSKMHRRDQTQHCHFKREFEHILFYYRKVSMQKKMPICLCTSSTSLHELQIMKNKKECPGHKTNHKPIKNWVCICFSIPSGVVPKDKHSLDMKLLMPLPQQLHYFST